MKLKEIKHNHSLTDLLKILIFSLLMLAPILSVATRCLYVVCNKNAYQSYYGETINQKKYIQITDKSQLVQGKTYHFDWSTYNNNGYGGNLGGFANRILFDGVSNITTSINGYPETLETNNYLGLYINSSNQLTINYNGTYYNPSNATLIFDFVYYSNNWTFDFTKVLIFNKIEYNNYSYLDNVFEYSVNSLEDNQLFNWTKNTAVYTGVNTMASNLEIEGSVIPILITYWFLLTIIYVIIDIVLKLFTILTHMIGNKTA